MLPSNNNREVRSNNINPLVYIVLRYFFRWFSFCVFRMPLPSVVECFVATRHVCMYHVSVLVCVQAGCVGFSAPHNIGSQSREQPSCTYNSSGIIDSSIVVMETCSQSRPMMVELELEEGSQHGRLTNPVVCCASCIKHLYRANNHREGIITWLFNDITRAHSRVIDDARAHVVFSQRMQRARMHIRTCGAKSTLYLLTRVCATYIRDVCASLFRYASLENTPNKTQYERTTNGQRDVRTNTQKHTRVPHHFKDLSSRSRPYKPKNRLAWLKFKGSAACERAEYALMFDTYYALYMRLCRCDAVYVVCVVSRYELLLRRLCRTTAKGFPLMRAFRRFEGAFYAQERRAGGVPKVPSVHARRLQHECQNSQTWLARVLR